MSDKLFVEAVFSELYGKNFSQYKDSLTKPVNGDKDSYARARNALASLSEAQKLDVVNFLKVVMADSASVILGTLDGVHFPDNLEGEFVLSVDGNEIQGDLQDIFIDKAQEEGFYN